MILRIGDRILDVSGVKEISKGTYTQFDKADGRVLNTKFGFCISMDNINAYFDTEQEMDACFKKIVELLKPVKVG